MRVPRPDDVGAQGQLVLEGVTDGLYAAVREAVCSLPLIPRLIKEKLSVRMSIPCSLTQLFATP